MGKLIRLGDRHLTVISHSQLAGSPAEAGALRAMAELLDRGQANYSLLAWNDPVAALYENDALVSAIVWREHDVLPAVWVVLGWTETAFRRQGMYACLFKEFAAGLRQAKPEVRRIESGYHSGNAASAGMHLKLGRRATGITTSIDIDQVEAPPHG